MFIDFHTHIWTKEMVSPGYKKYLNNFSEIAHIENNQYKADPNTLIEDLDDAEIDKAIIFVTDYSFTEAKMAISIEDYINFVIKSCDEYNDKFIGLVGVDPRHGEKALDLIKYGIEQGLKGLVLTPTTGFYLNDKIVNPLYDLARELKIPVIIHDFELVPMPFSIKYIEPFTLDDVLMKYLDVKFVIAPIGMATGQTVMMITIRHISHVYGEISGFSTQFMVNKMPDMFLIQPLGMAKTLYGSENLLFGSNWPFFENVVNVKEWLQKIKSAKLPLLMRPFGFPSLEDEDRENILGINAAKLFGVKIKPNKKK